MAPRANELDTLAYRNHTLLVFLLPLQLLLPVPFTSSFSVITILETLELQGSISVLLFLYTLAAVSTSSSSKSEI